jgi:hypothetical protein
VDQEVVGSIPISHPTFRGSLEFSNAISMVTRYPPFEKGHVLPENDGKELRADVRRRTILGGKIISDSGQVKDCLIMDLSLAGVRCRCGEPMESKTFVNVRINRFGELRRAEVMWVRGDQVGLRFTEKIAGDTGTSTGIGKLLKPISDSTGRDA